MSENLKLPTPAENALSGLQDTQLSPMEEALFKTWTKANQITKPDAPDDSVDYRGIFKHTNGLVLPTGQLKEYADKLNKQNLLQRILHERMQDRIAKLAGSKEDLQQQQFKAERQDVTHSQKMQMENMKLKQQPHEVKLAMHDNAGKELDIDKAKVANEGKHLDIIAAVAKPKEPASSTNKE